MHEIVVSKMALQVSKEINISDAESNRYKGQNSSYLISRLPPSWRESLDKMQMKNDCIVKVETSSIHIFLLE